MSSVLFRGGRIITATGIFDGEVLTKDGVICEVSLGGKVSGEAEQVINLEGKYLSPGFMELILWIALQEVWSRPVKCI